MKILHVATHLGGGVGKAISGIAIQAAQQGIHSHRICLLQQPEKDEYVRRCKENGVFVQLFDDCTEWFNSADVIVVSWWNHPQMSRFLVQLPQCNKPYILWSHVNGAFYPVLPFWLTQAFDWVLLTSSWTLHNPAWTLEQQRKASMRADIVYGMGQFIPSALPQKLDYTQKDRFTVGYVGTLNYGKIHPQFTSYCLAAVKKIPNIQFVLVGDCDHKLQADIQRMGLESYVTLTGFVSNVMEWMQSFDVFGYLLQPKHYGTTENVLLEAMACGVPVIARRQNVEQVIVPREAGYLIETPDEYVQALYRLYTQPALRERMGKQARQHTIKQYNTVDNLEVFHNACQKAIQNPQGTRDFSSFGNSAWEWFLACLNKEDKLYFIRVNELLSSQNQAEQEKAKQLLADCPLIFREERKSSLRHFSATYPHDKQLKRIADFLCI